MGVKSAPRAIGAMAPERAGPERASRGGVSLARFQANSEGPCRGTSPAQGGIARAGGSEGCARCPARATAPGPRSKTKPPRSGRRERGRPPGGQEESLTQWRQRESGGGGGNRTPVRKTWAAGVSVRSLRLVLVAEAGCRLPSLATSPCYLDRRCRAKRRSSLLWRRRDQVRRREPAITTWLRLGSQC